MSFWNFDMLFTENWVIIANFWNKGGVFKAKDVLFILSILIAVFIWTYSLIKLMKFNYVNILIYPVSWYNNYITKKYGSNSSRIIFKNLKSSKDKMTFEEMVEMKMKKSESKNEKELEADKIRNVIQEKIKNKK